MRTRKAQSKLYQVEKIVGKRVVDLRTEYLVKWNRYSRGRSTWEPAASLNKDLIHQFQRQALALTQNEHQMSSQLAHATSYFHVCQQKQMAPNIGGESTMSIILSETEKENNQIDEKNSQTDEKRSTEKQIKQNNSERSSDSPSDASSQKTEESKIAERTKIREDLERDQMDSSGESEILNVAKEAQENHQRMAQLAYKVDKKKKHPSFTMCDTSPVSKRTRKQEKMEIKKQKKLQSALKQQNDITFGLEPQAPYQNISKVAEMIEMAPKKPTLKKKSVEIASRASSIRSKSLLKEESLKMFIKIQEQKQDLRSRGRNPWKNESKKLKKKSYEEILEIRQLQRGHRHQVEYLVTCCNYQLKILTLRQLVKDYPQDLVKYFDSKVNF